ncbi:unnamed protein product [Gongylonema pulchrum]|uniref:Transposase n=1 Tax=Gongylonema pulchrum TaxID=637853 RepID=A0A183DJI0_9BILA|nr:unnamed protein product [Gongylonema pulchrum]
MVEVLTAVDVLPDDVDVIVTIPSLCKLKSSVIDDKRLRRPDERIPV